MARGDSAKLQFFKSLLEAAIHQHAAPEGLIMADDKNKTKQLTVHEHSLCPRVGQALNGIAHFIFHPALGGKY